jgi:hypothetical protein
MVAQSVAGWPEVGRQVALRPSIVARVGTARCPRDQNWVARSRRSAPIGFLLIESLAYVVVTGIQWALRPAHWLSALRKSEPVAVG